MSELISERQDPPGAPPAARFDTRRLALWLPICLVHGTAISWLAYGVEKHFAPLGIFPFLVGIALGMTLAGLMRLVQVANRSTIVLGTIVAASTTIYGQHYFSYQEQREAAERQAAQFRIAARAHPGLVRGTPPKPASGVFEYLRWQALRGRPIAGKTVARGAWAWASWTFDGCLTLLAALIVIVPASRQPYCNRCRTWYSTVRRGRLVADAAAELASVIGMEAPDDIREASFRFVHCQNGCGQAGLEICWVLADGRRRTTRGWISADEQPRLSRLLTRPLNPES